MAEENKPIEEVVVEETKAVKETKTENNQEKNNDNVTKVKMKQFKEPEDDIIKVDLSKSPTQEVEQSEQEVVEEKLEEKKEQDTTEESIVQEVTNEESVEKVEETLEEAIEEATTTGKPLPENVQKLVNFIEETGGDINDYVKLNRDIEKMDDSDVLDEYYKETKPHLSSEERGFLLEDTFGIDEVDDERTTRKKKIALKEQVAEARAHLDRQKSKYYEDIKGGSKLTTEQQKAVDFFNRYNKENEQQKKVNESNKRTFLNKTNSLFNDEFKGFEYNVGDKKFRFNIKDVNKVKETQSDLNNFVNKFVGENKDTIEDAVGYHKSLFTAMNPDAIARHFYEQGKADAIKDTVAKDKNINLNPRKTHGETNVGGVKYRVLGDSTDDFKFKIKRKK